MLTRSLCLALACLLGAAACAGAPPPSPALPAQQAPLAPPPPPPSATPPAGDWAPTPYTSDQLRDASRVGRRYVFRVEVPGKPTVLRTLAFTRVEAARVEVTTTVTTEDGKVVTPPEAAWATWEELQKHAQFPRDQVSTTDEEITVPAGRFRCTVYRVARDGGETWRFYFARELPGPPVLFYKERGGPHLSTSTLIEYRAGT